RPRVQQEIRDQERQRKSQRPKITSSRTGVRVAAPIAGRQRALPLDRSFNLRLLTRDGDAPEDLRYAGPEAEDVARLYGVQAPNRLQPTEQWFRQRAPSADVIHLATHGYFRDFHPMSS